MNRNIDGKQFIGQLAAEKVVDHWVANSNFPHFLLIIGEEGSGKKTLSYLIAQSLNCSVYTLPDCAVDTVRQFIASSYEVDSPIVYLIPDADGMSIAAKNSLLKLTEEPPENAYIIMTLKSADNTLPTIISRGQQIVMSAYTDAELQQLSQSDNQLLAAIANTPGMLHTLEQLGVDKVNSLIEYCDKLVMFIDRVPVFNALKSIQNVKLKDTDKGFELTIVVAALRYIIHSGISDANVDAYKLVRYKAWLMSLSYYKPLFDRPGLNKKALWDEMILKVRSIVQEV